MTLSNHRHCLAPCAESPQWRRGPAAKPILCNACGTRYRRTQQLAPLAPAVGGRASTRKRRATAAEQEDDAAAGARPGPASVASSHLLSACDGATVSINYRSIRGPWVGQRMRRAGIVRGMLILPRHRGSCGCCFYLYMKCLATAVVWLVRGVDRTTGPPCGAELRLSVACCCMPRQPLLRVRLSAAPVLPS